MDKKAARHGLNVAAVTLYSRETNSRSSPRKRRSTASVLRLTEKRLLLPDFLDTIDTPFAYEIRLWSIQDNPRAHHYVFLEAV